MLVLAAETARAENVVVLEFSGDTRGRLRGQVERALKRLDQVEVVPLARYKAETARLKLRGAKAMTPEAVARVSSRLKLAAAVDGAVGATFFVRIVDPQGEELWTKDLPLKKGVLSAPNAFALARAVNAAAKMGAQRKTPAAEEPPEDEEPVAQAPPPPQKTPPPAEPPQETTPPSTGTVVPEPPVQPSEATDPMAEAHTVTQVEEDPDLVVQDLRKPRVGPSLITLRLGAVSTWRSYCSRPGVSTCAAYDSLPEDQKFRDTVTFNSTAPYFGFGGSLELFPFAGLNNIVKGLGLGVGYSRGFSLIQVNSPLGGAPTEVVASDEAWFLQFLPRVYFGLWEKQLSGFVGLRGGLESRNFDVDVSASTSLPGSHRRYWTVGLDFALPTPTRFFRLEGSGTFFLNPRAGEEELAGYGQSVTGAGFALEGGLGGEIAGPFGYTLRLRMAKYKDAFSGAGSKWTQTSVGVAEETYTTATFQLNAHF